MNATEKANAREAMWQYLIKNNLRETTLAMTAGIDFGNMSRFLSGKNQYMGEYTLRKVALVLGKTYEELIGGDSHDQQR